MYRIPRLASEQLDGVLPEAGEPPPEAARPAAAVTVGEDEAAFFSLSAELTGFDEVELQGTGVGGAYLRWLSRVFPDELAKLLALWRTIERDLPVGRREAAVRRILHDAALGPFTQAVLALWYTATWTPPAGSRRTQENIDRAFGAAYPEGLMWRAAIGSHPGGAQPTGFGTWSLAPEET